jgi:hypothetical protein
MDILEKEISDLKAKIDMYETQLQGATTEKEKIAFLVLVLVRDEQRNG